MLVILFFLVIFLKPIYVLKKDKLNKFVILRFASRMETASQEIYVFNKPQEIFVLMHSHSEQLKLCY